MFLAYTLKTLFNNRAYTPIYFAKKFTLMLLLGSYTGENSKIIVQKFQKLEGACHKIRNLQLYVTRPGDFRN